jgi:hypothetical protein
MSARYFVIDIIIKKCKNLKNCDKKYLKKCYLLDYKLCKKNVQNVNRFLNNEWFMIKESPVIVADTKNNESFPESQ